MGDSQKKRSRRAQNAAEFVDHARKLRDYFARNARNDPSFEPEREVAEQIVAVMEATYPDPAAVLELLGSLDERDHYNGSGWFDFTNQVRGWVNAVEGQR